LALDAAAEVNQSDGGVDVNFHFADSIVRELHSVGVEQTSSSEDGRVDFCPTLP
jgi:hypothetical protein